MSKTTVLYKTFEDLSSTGKKFLLLKATNDCDCYDPKSLVNSEPEPHCEKCFGTGQVRLPIISEFIRSENESSGMGKSVENINHVKTIEELKRFYFHERYNFLGNEDLICQLEDGKVERVYKIKAKEVLNCVDFSYIEITGRKINHFINVGGIDV